MGIVWVMLTLIDVGCDEGISDSDSGLAMVIVDYKFLMKDESTYGL